MRTRPLVVCVLLLSCQSVNPSGVTDESPYEYDRNNKRGGLQSNTELDATSVEAKDDEETSVEVEPYVHPEAKCTYDGGQVMTLINVFRSENGKPALPEDDSLCQTARAHLSDLLQSVSYAEEGCEAKSWSDWGPWEPCCYLPDNSNPECMWDKPSEINGYEGLGYELVALNSGGPREVVETWLEDPGLREMVLQEGQWQNTSWSGVGADYVDGAATLWFGDAP